MVDNNDSRLIVKGIHLGNLLPFFSFISLEMEYLWGVFGLVLRKTKQLYNETPCFTITSRLIY